MGAHYARTLADWRERFHAEEPAVPALGFDNRFLRTWDYYLATAAAPSSNATSATSKRLPPDGRILASASRSEILQGR